MMITPTSAASIASNVPLLASGSNPVSSSNQSHFETPPQRRSDRFAMVAMSLAGEGTTMPPRSTAQTGVSLDGLEWRQLGPFRGGRVEAVAGDPRERNTFYFGSCGGGVWKTTDGGLFWRNVSDGFFKRASGRRDRGRRIRPERRLRGNGRGLHPWQRLAR